MMLKQSPSRKQSSKGFKVKHILQICLLLGLCIWLLNQLKDSHDKNRSTGNSTVELSGDKQTQLKIARLGRKGLRPKGDDGEVEEEIKSDVEDDGRGGGEDEIDGADQERSEEEDADEIEDLIDVDDREEIQEKNKSGSKREGHEKNGDDSISLFHKIRTITTQLETGAIRRT